jgi:uncharacterized membrane protein HdeD (DUF308 family)
MQSTKRRDDVSRVRVWLRLTGGLALLAGLVCMAVLVATGGFGSPTRVLVVMAGIGLIVYGIAALTTVVGQKSPER